MAARGEIDWSRVRAEAFERFGVRRFRRGQRELVEAALSGRDAVGILPGGADRSLTFELPAALLPGAVVVVSTHGAGEADAAGTSRPGHDALVHLAPASLARGDTLETLRARGISLLVVDEAHRVSRRGDDFRPEYLGLGDAARALGRPPILALAAGPPQVVDDVVDQLGLEAPLVVATGDERENVFFEVRPCAEPDDKDLALRRALREAGGAAVVHCATIRAALDVHARLARAGVVAELYHERRRAADRARVERRFTAGEVQVMVGTSAFGVGLDRQDVRLVAHWSFPDSVEAYYQEAGRAGRDGAPARALLLYRPEDQRLQSFSLGGRYPPREELRAVWAALERAGSRPLTPSRLAEAAGLSPRRAQSALSVLRSVGVAARRGGGFRKARDFASPEEWEAFLASSEARHELDRERLRAIVRYAQTALCRMRSLREYFGEERGAPCGHCDNCRDRPQIAAEVLRAEAEAERRPGLG